MVAYEPVWAIGTGRAATADDAQETIAVIRATVADLVGRAAADGPHPVRRQRQVQQRRGAGDQARRRRRPGRRASLDADEFAMIIKGSARRAR